MPYVYSTITNDVYYCEYNPSEKGAPKTVKKRVLIKGGTGVSNKHFFTPMGVVTSVSDEDLAFLKGNEAFNRHQSRGFVVVGKDKVDPEKVAADMKIGDGSSPIVPEDFNADDQAKPVVDKPSLGKKILEKMQG